MSTRRGFGQVSQLRSGRWQARWRRDGKWHTARLTYDDEGHRVDHGPLTFNTRRQAENHLVEIEMRIQRGVWRPPIKPEKAAAADVLTLREFAHSWLDRRQLKPRTRSHYRSLLDRAILPRLGDVELASVDQDAVDAWYATLPADKPTQRAHAYALLRSILSDAAERKLISDVPKIKGAGKTTRAREMHVMEPHEIAALADAMPQRYRLAVVLSAWCALRYGELIGLRAMDVDTDKGLVHVRRGITRANGQWYESTPKNGRTRVVRVPSRIADDLAKHVATLAPDELLFPAPRGGFMIAPTFGKPFRRAADAIGRPDVVVHDLRHFGCTRFAMAGATLAELMEFAGHLTVDAASRYFHVANNRMDELTARMDAMADG